MGLSYRFKQISIVHDDATFSATLRANVLSIHSASAGSQLFVGRAHSNLILDTRTYEVEFINGQNAELAANVIAHNMFAQCNSKGNTYSYPVSSITEKMTLQLKRRICISNTGQICIRGKPQKEWSPCVEWKDGSTSWEHLANLKESNPVEVADFTTAHGLDTEPAIA